MHTKTVHSTAVRKKQPAKQLRDIVVQVTTTRVWPGCNLCLLPNQYLRTSPGLVVYISEVRDLGCMVDL